MVDSVATSADMRANSHKFLYNLKTTDSTLKNVTKTFLLESEGYVFCLETTDVDVTRVLVAQVLINLKEEAILKENLNEIVFSDFSGFTTMSSEQHEDFQKNFPDLLVCKFGKEQLDKQSCILLKSWMNTIKVTCKKIIFFVENPEHLEKSLVKIEMANIVKLKLDKLWKKNEIITINEAIICEAKNDEANSNEQSVVNNESTSARASDEGSNVNNVVEEEHAKTSLNDKATADDKADLVKLLQSLGIDELDAVDEDGDTQLHLAAHDGETQIVESLLAHGAKKDLQNNDGETALHLAVQKGHSAIVQMLLEYGFNVNATDNNFYQWTPLHDACECHNDAHLIEILIKFGAGMERKDIMGRTALHLASRNGRSTVVNSLLKHGTEINAQDANENSPLHLATLLNRQEVVQILLEHGADLSIKNGKQKNALDLARSRNLTNLIQILENHK